MIKEQTDKPKQDAKKPSEDELINAVRIVNEAIRREEKKLKDIVDAAEEQPLIKIEGVTTTGHLCELMVEPQHAAAILLDHNYPVWNVLMQDYPDAMWKELGESYGLESACSIFI